jgi:hypothetical protein
MRQKKAARRRLVQWAAVTPPIEGYDNKSFYCFAFAYLLALLPAIRPNTMPLVSPVAPG